ncbi:PRA1 family protein B2-like [Brachypodium distachyon]|uniref:PRA1 family protein B2-like n=1 Tax=Brachypodium distachyon TaxID=15368 RepID=UPI000D0E04DE|nr:PRA1 family protein B2-like [Brachypodium distachyon]|eukprot:XP_014757867.2 PRA1 family protein B2-like [Brachypodium distachyon]
MVRSSPSVPRNQTTDAPTKQRHTFQIKSSSSPIQIPNPSPRTGDPNSSAMAAAAAPILPTTLPATVPSAAAPATSPIPTAISSSPDPAATRAFLLRLYDTAKTSLSTARPWAELLDRTALSRPDTVSAATSRLRKNLPYFRVNYLALISFTLAVSLLAHPFALLALLALLAAWCLLYLLRDPATSPPLAAFGRTFSDRETLGGLVAASAFVVFLTSVGGIIFSALALGAAVVCVHGTFRVPEDLFLDDVPEQDPASLGLLGFINSSAGAAGGAARV